MKSVKPCLLMILDGWGKAAPERHNAVSVASTPSLDKYFNEYPSTTLLCSGESVGLPEGIMGNSEVGHLNIGAGRVLYQTLLRINRSIGNGSFFNNTSLATLMADISSKGSTLHLMGLASDGGVHSQLAHLFALIDMAEAAKIENICIHATLDGRDTPPTSGVAFIKQLQDHVQEKKSAYIGTLCGRFYAMDRDNRWERTERAFRLYTEGEGLSERDPVEAVKNAYARGETDEFVKPVCIKETDTDRPLMVEDGDGVIFFNFRADRARQMTRAFTAADFDGFHRKIKPGLTGYVCMTLYDDAFNLPVAFPPQVPNAILGEVISQKGLKQLRIAETEKYAHVTYFFNGGLEKPFEHEERSLIPSPREAETYDQVPEMSALKITDTVIEKIRCDHYDLIVLNYANMDMVGHTGVMEAAVKAVETVDHCVGKVVEEFRKKGGSVLITADHGNSEKMADGNGGVHTAHTLNPVPLILVDDAKKEAVLKEGKLGDIAPTVLELMGIEIPEAMTGCSLIAKP